MECGFAVVDDDFCFIQVFFHFNAVILLKIF